MPNDIPSPHKCNLLRNLRAGYAVQSPKGSMLFEEGDLAAAIEYASQHPKSWVDEVILAEQYDGTPNGRTCQLPKPSGWTTHKAKEADNAK
jgi:hypothetical protein